MSRRLASLLAFSLILPLAILLPLAAMNARLGQGYFAYRWSPVRDLRTPRTFPLLLLAAAACGAVYLLHRSTRPARAAGLTLLGLTFFGAAAWCWWAPPVFLNQQMFNMTSFSTDGAFVVEARQVESLPRYLRDFPQRLRTSVQEMGGTRVLSNPPLTTVIAYVITGGPRGELPGSDSSGDTSSDPTDSTDDTDQPWDEESLGAIERALVEGHGVSPQDAPVIADALRVSLALLALWALSGAAAYLLGRVFLSQSGSAVFALIVLFNPSTVHFAPGKDAAQLLTINLMLWAWFAGSRRQSLWLAALGGAILVVGSTMGLIHLWVALPAVIATQWEARSWRPSRQIFAAAGGALLVCALAYLAIGWNIPATLLAVSRRWGEIQKTFDMSRGIWLVIGLPIFLLFLSAPFWALLSLTLRRRRLNFGTRLLICTGAVMLFIYFVMGVTYELPRLWIAFLPPLMLGLAIDRPIFRGRGEHPRVARALMLIVLVHIVFTSFQWTLFDAREAEFRLTSRLYYN